MNHRVFEAQSFWDCVIALQRDETHQAALLETLTQLRIRPFQNPKLQTHYVGTALNGKKIYSSDVGGRASDRRLVWQLFNDTIVVLLYGTHAVQRRAKRMRIDFDPAERVVTVFEQTESSGGERPYHVARDQVGKLFMSWTDSELNSYGLPEPTVQVLRRVQTESELLDLQDAMAPPHFELAYNLIAHGHPEPEEAALALANEVRALADQPEPTPEDVDLGRKLADPKIGALFISTEPEFLKEILSKPIEDWMIFLHPEQRAITSRHFEGPAQVRGAAGTGKTVVGLHRAAWLAKRNRELGETLPILVTTYIRSLPPVLEALYLRLPETTAGEVEFVHIDRLANQICSAGGERRATDSKVINRAFASAHKQVVVDGTPLAGAGFSRQYLKDEIAAVIKGRGISTLEEYRALRRTGRRAPMGAQQREQVWTLKEEWDAEMAKRGNVDFPDVVHRARDLARATAARRYSAIIVDEAQDLTLVGLQLLRALVNGSAQDDRANGLMLLGDGAQRIYTGGFTLGQAGLEVRGRSTVLKTNYRNTAEIVGAAMTVAGDAEVDDLGETFRRGDATVYTLRRSRKPLLFECASFEDQLREVWDSVTALTEGDHFSTGDIGVLLPTNRMVKQTLRYFREAGLSAQDLARYEGRPNDLVKVGTYHRAKGLEFKVVFLPGLSDGMFPVAADIGAGPEEAAEAESLAVSQLFVAMTRARDLLVVLYEQSPSQLLQGHVGAFDHHKL